jgi:ABC-type taurine transport system ATPase subunit
VKAPLEAEKVVGVAPALPPTPRLTVMPFPMPRVAHKSTNAPPQLVVVEVKEAPGGKVIPVGIEIALVMGPRSLVMDPTSLVMDATTLDSCERIEEMEAVASL